MSVAMREESGEAAAVVTRRPPMGASLAPWLAVELGLSGTAFQTLCREQAAALLAGAPAALAPFAALVPAYWRAVRGEALLAQPLDAETSPLPEAKAAVPRQAEPLALALLTGPLGVGKTTLIRRLLARPEMARTAVVVNEFGAIDLDGALVRSGGRAAEIVTLSNNCVCCSARDDLCTALQGLLDQRSAGLLDFDRVLVEASGMADPAGVIAALKGDVALGRRIRLTLSCRLIDATAGDAASPAEAGGADLLLLARSGQVAPASLAALRRRLAVGAAGVAHLADDETGLSLLSSLCRGGLPNLSPAVTPQAGADDALFRLYRDPPAEMPVAIEAPSPGQAALGTATAALQRPEAPALAPLCFALDLLGLLLGRDLARLKAHWSDGERCVALGLAFGLVFPAERLPDRALPPGLSLALIAGRLPAEEIAAALDHFCLGR